MRIIIPTFEKLRLMPPTVTLVETLSALGHEVCLITLYREDPDALFPGCSRVQNFPLRERELDLILRAKSRLLKSVAFRLERFLYRLSARKTKKIVKDLMTPDAILWIVNEMTVYYTGNSLTGKNTFLFSSYELHTKRCRITRRTVKAMQKATVNVVPDYFRAHIERALYRLSEVPLVLQNKNAHHPRTRCMPLSDSQLEETLNALKKRYTLLVYSGSVSKERDLEPILRAISRRDDYRLLIIGGENAELQRLRELYGDRLVYLGYHKNPAHLALISYADIGIVNYYPEKHALNAVFCAPNKVFEYAGFGIPMLANDIPGLSSRVAGSGAGVCFEGDDPTEILEKLDLLRAEYDIFSAGAVRYFDSEDITASVQKILQTYQKKTGK